MPRFVHPPSTVQRAKELRLQGLAWNEIQAAIGVDQRTIRRWLPAADYSLTMEQAAAAERRWVMARRATLLADRPAPVPGVIWVRTCGEWVPSQVDLEDWETYRHHAWSLLVQTRAPAARYAKASVHGRTEYLHRLILGLEPGRGWGRQTDHINRDTLDNRRANLRVVTPKQNCANRGGKYEPAI